MAFFNINRVGTGNRIRKHRLEMNLSQEKLASLLSEMGVEISPVSIGKWERGECDITEAHARALCEVFGCKLSELVVARLSYYDDERDQLAPLIIIYFHVSNEHLQFQQMLVFLLFQLTIKDRARTLSSCRISVH